MYVYVRVFITELDHLQKFFPFNFTLLFLAFLKTDVYV